MRHTKTRRRLITALSQGSPPFSVPNILEWYRRHHHPVHKTTLYRDLALFEQGGLIRTADFGDGTKRYELVDGTHHHHLVCENCQSVMDVAMPNDLAAAEQHIQATYQFMINRHSLEFFGLCHTCQI